MSSNLALATSQNFGNVSCDFWKNTEQQEFYMTREQIGIALDYSIPDNAIIKIHERHSERLDKFSTYVTLTQVEGKREVSRDVIAYSSKGMYEICRWSRQPKADAFMDWVWEVIDSLRTGESRLTQNNVTYSPQAIQEMMNEYLNVFKKDIINEMDSVRDSLLTDIDKRMVTIANSHLYLVKLVE